jgi:ABC-2 type transport system permease protein
VIRQTKYEQLAFWRNPFGAAFTLGFSTVFLILLAASGGTSRVNFLGNIRAIQYYVAGFLAYGVMSACFSTLAISIVVRRETGLLKRLRLSPLPTWAVLGAIFANALIVSALQVGLLLAIGSDEGKEPLSGACAAC